MPKIRQTVRQALSSVHATSATTAELRDELRLLHEQLELQGATLAAQSEATAHMMGTLAEVQNELVALRSATLFPQLAEARAFIADHVAPARVLLGRLRAPGSCLIRVDFDCLASPDGPLHLMQLPGSVHVSLPELNSTAASQVGWLHATDALETLSSAGDRFGNDSAYAPAFLASRQGRLQWQAVWQGSDAHLLTLSSHAHAVPTDLYSTARTLTIDRVAVHPQSVDPLDVIANAPSEHLLLLVDLEDVTPSVIEQAARSGIRALDVRGLASAWAAVS